MDVREDTVAFPLAGDETAETWYRVTGDLRPDDADAPTPLIVLHGGPVRRTTTCSRSRI